MANEAYIRTNQALTFARLALASWEASSASTALDAVTMARYHREHTLFHAYRATQSLIVEVSGRYNLAPWDTSTVEQMLSAIGDGEFLSPELSELALQSGDSSSWLAGMLLAWRQLHAPPGAAVTEPLKAGTLIASTAAAGGEWGLAEARVAIEVLSKLLDRYRESMREW
ncbi:DUF6586 family protein [Pseudomonas sp. FME51]|uniref:DUF6586 family protein n=1 Tax=Pseudomonas sp. FME51 TaxID=2742609 RepID=UPI00186633F1|nr:DUF6586 family protein [Pseudomonas sp. FME51]